MFAIWLNSLNNFKVVVSRTLYTMPQVCIIPDRLNSRPFKWNQEDECWNVAVHSGPLRWSTEGQIHGRGRTSAGCGDQTTETDDVWEVLEGVWEGMQHHDEAGTSKHCPHHWTVTWT